MPIEIAPITISFLIRISLIFLKLSKRRYNDIPIKPKIREMFFVSFHLLCIQFSFLISLITFLFEIFFCRSSLIRVATNLFLYLDILTRFPNNEAIRMSSTTVKPTSSQTENLFIFDITPNE